MPCFEGLLPAPHNKIVLDLLFNLAAWHGYAKLRLHTEKTLAFFETTINSLRHSVYKFQEMTCSTYQTTELPQESAARGRRQAALAAKQDIGTPSISLKAKIKHLNLTTYKYHALADYPNTIRRYGTTDNYTTQTVSTSFTKFPFLMRVQGELEHRRLKRRYPRSGKKKSSMVASIANQEAIERFIKQFNNARQGLSQRNKTKQRVRSHPSEHHRIAESSRKADNLTAWLAERRDDPAFDVSHI